MFLNWVYRRTSDTLLPPEDFIADSNRSICNTPPSGSSNWRTDWQTLEVIAGSNTVNIEAPWLGFRNMDQNQQFEFIQDSAGNRTPSLAGNARYIRMTRYMVDMMQTKGWRP